MRIYFYIILFSFLVNTNSFSGWFDKDKIKVSKCYDVKQFNSYINYSPFAKGMSNKSPGRIAYWLGWKIVYEYIENNKNLTLEQLMQNTDAQQILQQSGYKP